MVGWKSPLAWRPSQTQSRAAADRDKILRWFPSVTPIAIPRLVAVKPDKVQRNEGTGWLLS
jgi:hypothetical protein